MSATAIRAICTRIVGNMDSATPISPTTITDPLDDRLAAYRNLKDVGARTAGTFIAESELVLRRVIDSQHPIRSILVTDSRFARLENVLREKSVRAPIFVTSAGTLDQVVGFPLHRGVLALVGRTPLPRLDEIVPGGAGLVVVMEDVVDPDNVGAVFRHAAGFGADAVILTEHSGDPLYRKAVRTSMGWVLDVPYTRAGTGVEVIDALTARGYAAVALTPDRGSPPLADVLSTLDPDRSVAFLLGAEAPGLRADTLARAVFTARIPMTGHVDSLNIATAAAIALYEFRRLRPIPE
jgi:tRNA G18 (ribose-2'-O)-methylase SpoU